MENNKDFLQKLRVFTTNSQQLNVINKTLEIKQSTKSNAGLGVFALEDIPSGTIFLECFNFNCKDKPNVDDDIGYFINDLAYNGDLVNYETKSNVNFNINVGYVCQYNDEATLFFGGEPNRLFLRSLRNIKKGEELSRYYGLDYWKSFKFWQKFPDCKFLTTYDHEDLPSEYIFIDKLSEDLSRSCQYMLYGKKINDKYYYIVTNIYFDYMTDDLDKVFEKYDLNNLNSSTNLFDSNNNQIQIINITKSDNTSYAFNEKIYEDNYLLSYLKYEYNNKIDMQIKHENEFWKNHPNSKFRETKSEDDLPNDYVCVDRLIDEAVDSYLGCPKSKYLFAKKSDNKFYYLVSKHLYNFDEFDRSYISKSSDERINQMTYRKIFFDENDYDDVSKSDHSKYYPDEKISGLVRLSYVTECEHNKQIQKEILKEEFLLKHNLDKHMIIHAYGDKFVEDAITNVYLPIESLTYDGDKNCVKYTLYCKKINNEYYYLMSDVSYEWSTNEKISEYFEPEFEEFSRSFIDITKPDKTKYDMLEEFPNHMHTEIYRHEKYKNTRSNNPVQKPIDNTTKKNILVSTLGMLGAIGVVGVCIAMLYSQFISKQTN